MKNLRIFLCFVVAFTFFVSLAATGADANVLRLATTTSTENSGLIEKLIPKFSDRYGVSVHTIAGGTGRALNHARNGDVDVVLVHAKKAELALVDSGYGCTPQGDHVQRIRHCRSRIRSCRYRRVESTGRGVSKNRAIRIIVHFARG